MLKFSLVIFTQLVLSGNSRYYNNIRTIITISVEGLLKRELIYNILVLFVAGRCSLEASAGKLVQVIHITFKTTIIRSSILDLFDFQSV